MRFVEAVQLDENDKFLMKYLLKEKQIPSDIPNSSLHDKQPMQTLIPSEESCPRCQTGLVKMKQTLATVYGFGVIWSGEHPYKSCCVTLLKMC